ncbi:MAG: cyclic pyranopterin monophosphate synthase MoaC [Gammaproteobacteria bacterium]|nr:cyclic pyranopterin monophosphate synthase MoaC [Gammaproteobacteria bacterium]MDH4253020.1 cyclic pyranopterin monophosphate synthase MoaC [Gammaproteobacteria bacterium]MDH5308558.1 cyclic pyranopterin monophosphate synthase MoaC [Gammaproteobacteria bacterium]
MSKLSHVDSNDRPTMVDVSRKQATDRTAHARAVVEFPRSLAERLTDGDIRTAKGPVFATAIVAGVMAAKKTHELIPFCHPLGLDDCKITIEMDGGTRAVIDCVCKVHHRTGVEMEALTGASIAALTVYDMCKALSHDIRIIETLLVAKTGGKKDFHRA